MSSVTADRTRRPVLETPAPPRGRPRHSRLLLIGLPIFAAFAAFGAIVWLAYEHGTPGSAIGEPPLVKAPAMAIKLAPDDPNASTVADQGDVRELLSDRPAGQLEQLLPPPEEPLVPPPTGTSPSPANEATAPTTNLAQGSTAPTDVTEPASPSGPEVATAPTATAPSTEASTATAPSTEAPTATAPSTEAPTAEAPSTEAPTAEAPSAQASAPVAEPPSALTPDEKAPPEQAAPAPSQEAEKTLDALFAEITGSNGSAPPASKTPADHTAPAETPVATAPPASPPASQAVQPPAVAPAPTAARQSTLSTTPSTSQTEGTAIASGEPLRQPYEPTSRAPAGQQSVDVQPLPGPGPGSVATPKGDYRIQLAAVRAEADARRAWDLFVVDLGPVLSGQKPIFERAETANGVFYRVQVGPFGTQQEAESLCDELKRRNASCFVLRR
jgi:hypothetical protein